MLLMGVPLSDWIQAAILVVLILYTRATYGLVKTALRQASASEEMTRAAVEQSRAAVEQAKAAVEQIEAAQRPCVVPVGIPPHDPEIEELARPEDPNGLLTLEIENAGNGPAIDLRLYVVRPDEGDPERCEDYRGPITLYPHSKLDTGITLAKIASMGKMVRLLIYFQSATGRGYLTSAEIWRGQTIRNLRPAVAA